MFFLGMIIGWASSLLLYASITYFREKNAVQDQKIYLLGKEYKIEPLSK